MDAAQAAHRWGKAHAEALSRLAVPGLWPEQRQQHQWRHPEQPRAARHGCSAALGRAAAPARPRGPAAPARPPAGEDGRAPAQAPPSPPLPPRRPRGGAWGWARSQRRAGWALDSQGAGAPPLSLLASTSEWGPRGSGEEGNRWGRAHFPQTGLNP